MAINSETMDFGDQDIKCGSLTVNGISLTSDVIELLSTLATADPEADNVIWNNNGVLTLSVGSGG